MEWPDFYVGFWDWADSTIRTRIFSLEDIGTGEEIVEVVCNLFDSKLQVQLIRKAMRLGAEFTKEDLLALYDELTDEVFQELADYCGVDIDEIEETDSQQFWEDEALSNARMDAMAKSARKPGFFGWLAALGSVFGGSSGKSGDNGRCNGNCAACPPHYGYRYGRWYYGHGHQYGCQRGGNGGASGKCSRD